MIIFEIGKSAGETGFNKISFVGFAIIFGVFSGSKSNDDGGNAPTFLDFVAIAQTSFFDIGETHSLILAYLILLGVV